jgi:hypothetical protein
MKRRMYWMILLLSIIPAAALAQSQFTFHVQQGDNVSQVPSGTTLTINSPSPGTPRSIKLLVTYTGANSVTFPTGVTVLGSPVFTAQLTSGSTALAPFQTATVNVVFTPSGTDAASGEIDLAYTETAAVGGQTTRGLLTFSISGGVPVYSLQYGFGTSGNVTAVAPGGQLTFPDTVVNSPATAALSLVNRGSSGGKITSVTLSGGTFTLASLPAFPVTLNAAASLPFQIVYLPRQAENDTGSLSIGFEDGISQQYQLQGRSIPSQLSYGIIESDNSVSALLPGQTIQFPPTAVGSSIQFKIRLTNTSQTDFVLSGITTTGVPYVPSGPLTFPVTIAPAGSEIITLSFSPTQLGQFSGSLRIGTDNFPLTGTSTGLPEYTIGGPTQVGPLEQPGLSLTLSQPYPVSLNGTLTLGVASDYAPDPSAQFSSGGRTASFTIPANSTNAVFSNGTNTIRIQTGSVASTFTLTPSFVTQQGVDVTPPSPATLQFAMPTSAPSLLGIQVLSQGNTTLTLRLLGVTSVRALTKLDIIFTAVPGFNVSNLSFTADLNGPSAVWFNSTTSQTFGGQFTLDVPFVLATSDTATTAAAPVQALQSVSMAVSSSVGDSNKVTLNLR